MEHILEEDGLRYYHRAPIFFLSASHSDNQLFLSLLDEILGSFYIFPKNS